MCGRSSLRFTPQAILEAFGCAEPPDLTPRYNIAPAQNQLTISRGRSGHAEAVMRKWGLVPFWADDPAIGHRLINARAEGIAEKPAFKWALRRRRCLILADGYYEWARIGKTKVPMFFRLRNDEAFGIAGLWERWDKAGEPLETCTVITTQASVRAAHVHERMPVILRGERAREWLLRGMYEDVRDLLTPYDGDDLEMYAVSRLVNDPANDSDQCTMPA